MIHQREIEILNILFGSEIALTSTDIVEQGNRLSQSTVQAVLRKLLKEGFVIVEGVTHSGNVLSRTYKPTEVAREAVKNQYIENYKSIMNIVPINDLLEEFKNMKEGRITNYARCSK